MAGAGGSPTPRPPPVELKIEVVLPEKDRGKEELSTSGKGSPPGLPRQRRRPPFPR